MASILYAKGKMSSVVSINKGCADNFEGVVNSLLHCVATGMAEDLTGEGQRVAVTALLHLPFLLDTNDKGVVTRPQNEIFAEVMRMEEKDRPRKIFDMINDKVTKRTSKATDSTRREQGKEVERTCRQVVRLVEEGEISRALKKLEGIRDEPQGEPLSQEEVKEKLRALHPEATQADKIEGWKAQRSPLRFEFDDVRRGVESCPRLSTGAMTPWTFDLIRQLLDRGKGEVFLQKVTFLFNRILEGKGGDTTAWTSSRMVALGRSEEHTSSSKR